MSANLLEWQACERMRKYPSGYARPSTEAWRDPWQAHLRLALHGIHRQLVIPGLELGRVGRHLVVTRLELSGVRGDLVIAGLELGRVRGGLVQLWGKGARRQPASI